MSISDVKIQEALDRIKIRNKTIFAETIMKTVSIDDKENPLEQIKRILAMKDSFVMLGKKANDNSEEVYETIVDSLSKAISEHAQILIDHAKESVSKI